MTSHSHGSRFLVLLFCWFSSCDLLHSQPLVSETPPRGWNSYDSYNWCINESEALLNAQAQAQYLLPFGYDYFVIDFLWYQDVHNASLLYIDAYGRLEPDPHRFPHSANGAGFTWLAEQVHNLGMKFGIHLMRGISQTAVDANVPVYGTNGRITTQQIQEPQTVCGWNSQFSNVNMDVDGGQQFYASLFAQYRDWGVDFIKNDCVYGNNFELSQIQAVHNAIEGSGRPMALSLSPGNYQPPAQHAQAIHNLTNMYRITNDDWDQFADVTNHFQVAAEHASAQLIGANGANGKSWPDCDMLPFGFITSPGGTCKPPYRMTALTHGQQRSQMSLWLIARSPIMFGGVVYKLATDDFTRNLLTNKLALSVNTNSDNNRQVSASHDTSGNPIQVVWAATQDTTQYFVAFFNVGGKSQTKQMNATLAAVTMKTGLQQCDVTDIWTGQSVNAIKNGVISASVPMDDTAFYFLQKCT